MMCRKPYLAILMMLVQILKAPPHQVNAEAQPDPQFQSYREIFDRPCNCVCGPRRHKLARIVGGTVSAPHQFPWLAAIFLNGGLFCGGSLITQKHILTAAHCLKVKNVRELIIVLGAHNFREMNGQQVHNVVHGLQHDGFETYEHDIGILTLQYPVHFTETVRPACLATNPYENYSGRVGVVAGWGNLGESSPKPDMLMRVDVPIIPNDECMASGYSPTEISVHMFCAGYAEGGRDACQGDSGGPFHLLNSRGVTEVIGIVSFGRGCARPNTPGVYTRVAHYIDWIKRNIGNHCLCPQSQDTLLDFSLRGAFGGWGWR